MQAVILVLITLLVLYRVVIRKNKPVPSVTLTHQSKYSKSREKILANVALANNSLKPTAWSAKNFVEHILEQKEMITPY